MKHWYHKPHTQLTEFVRTILVIEGYTTPEDNSQPIFTNGMSTIYCRTEKSKTGYEHVEQLSLYGNSTPPDCWSINEQTTIIAYFFKPFVLASLFNIPCKKLMNAPIDLSNWSPHKFNALKAQLIYSGSTVRKIEVLDNLLVHQLHQTRTTGEIIKYATDLIMCNPSTEILSEILKTLKLQERTFQRIFKKYVGVTPTQYRRICQFQQCFTQLQSNQFSKTSDVAFDSNFADQSHFIRSFREFAQTTPYDYLLHGLTGKK